MIWENSPRPMRRGGIVGRMAMMTSRYCGKKKNMTAYKEEKCLNETAYGNGMYFC